MERAADDGYVDIVELMLEAGATSFNWSYKNACQMGHEDIMELLELWMD